MASESKRRYDRSEKGKATKKNWIEKNKDKFRKTQRKYRQSHIEQRREAKKIWYENNKEHKKEYEKKWAKEHPEKCHEKRIRYYKNNLEKCRGYSNEYGKSEKGKQSIKQREMNIKLEVFNNYCHGDIKCMIPLEYSSHPGYDIIDIDVLTIDHIGGGGGKHRKELKGKSGRHFWLWLIKQGFPEGYRVLCWNCQRKEAKRLGLLTGAKNPYRRYKYPPSTDVCSAGQDQPDTPLVSPVVSPSPPRER